jgi:hypothetical protein
MFLLTRFGDPPISADQVREYVAKVRDELKNPDLHIWHYAYVFTPLVFVVLTAADAESGAEGHDCGHICSRSLK